MRIAKSVLFTSLLLFVVSGALAQPPLGPPGGFRRFDGPTREVPLTPEEVEIQDGTATVPDKATFDRLSYRGPEVLIDTHLADQQFVKFQIESVGSGQPQLYFINTKTHRAHMMFMRAVGIPMRGRRGGRENGGMTQMRVLIYHPRLKTLAGDTGLYSYEFEPNDSFPFEMIDTCHQLLIEKMPLLKDRLVYYPMPAAMPQYEKEKEKYVTAGLPVYLDQDIDSRLGYLPLNLATSCGRLKRLEHDERPSPRDIVLVNQLPNELPRVAGIVSAVRQTPLSHVNLRAIQDGVPNAFIHNADHDEHIQSLLGKHVFLRVAADDYELRAATRDEVDAYFDSIRPSRSQVPARDLNTRKIRRLNEVTFSDSSSVGTKAANLAAMHDFGLPPETVPSGHAIPFYVYDEFMKHNGLYDEAQEIIDDAENDSRETVSKKLKAFRARIKRGDIPGWMKTELTAVQHAYPAHQPLRCRSSTNNEDLPGFSGAGLYDSFTHRPDEGHLSKTVKQVYASLWNLRAFEERDFYRVDHLATAMGVLVHPNFANEIANGVGVTDDVFYQTSGNYYLNTQVGEDLVTNPTAQSIPEEILINWSDASDFKVMRFSNRQVDGELILTDDQREQLNNYLGRIHGKFTKLYGVDLQDPHFAMEIEYKLTASGKLVIKQARPWVYAATSAVAMDTTTGK